MTSGPDRFPALFRNALERRPFRPHPLLFNGHLQTLASSRLARDFPWGFKTSRCLELELHDGVRVRLAVAERDRSAPTLVLLHGMGGSSRSGYMVGLSHKAWREGWNSIRLDLYNRNKRVSPPKIFHAGCNRDVAAILSAIVSRLGFGRLLLCGVSMGGNIILRLLGEWNVQAPPDIVGAAVMSPLVDLTSSSPILERPSNSIYRRYFVTRLRRLVQSHSEQLGHLVDLEALAAIRHIREFDELVTAPLAGFDNAVQYYQEASAFPLLSRIRIPTLVLHALDDPLLPSKPLCHPSVLQNPAILLHLTSKGGHAGFMEANAEGDIDRRWAENRIIEYFRALTAADNQNGRIC